MSVLVEQFDKGKRNGVTVTVTAKDGADDATLLQRKADSHQANGWEISKLTAKGFQAKKQRHGGVCRRRFWVD